MCFPGAAALIAVATTAASAKQASSDRNKQRAFQQQQEEAERRNALASQAIATEEIHAQQLADTEASAVEIEQNRRAAASAIGTARVVAGEVGAFGLSFEGLVNEFARQQAEFEGSIETNLQIRNTFRRLNIDATQLTTNARLYNAKTLAPSSPNFANYALQGLNTYFAVSGALPKGP